MRCGLDEVRPTASSAYGECWSSRSACFGRFHEAQSSPRDSPFAGTKASSWQPSLPLDLVMAAVVNALHYSIGETLTAAVARQTTSHSLTKREP